MTKTAVVHWTEFVAWLRAFVCPSVRMPPAEIHVFWLIGLVMLFAGFDLNIYGLALPQIQATLHIPDDRLGETLSIVRLSILIALPLAWTADLFGRRRLLLLSSLGMGAATLLSGLAGNYEHFVWCQFLTRVFGYTVEILCYVIIAEEVSAALRGWALGALATVNYIGAGIVSMCFSPVYALGGSWQSLFQLGSVSVFFVLVLYRFLPETRRFCVRQAHLDVRSNYQQMREIFAALFGEHRCRLLLLMAASATFGFALWPALVMGPTYLQSTLHFTALETMLLIVTGGGIAALANVMAGRLSDRIGRRSVVILAILMSLTGYGIFFGIWHNSFAALMWPVGFFGFLCCDGLLAALAAELFPTVCRATVSGLRYACGILAGALSLLCEGWLFDTLNGGHGTAVLMMMLAAPVAVFALQHLPEPAGRELEAISGTKPDSDSNLADEDAGLSLIQRDRW